MTLPRRTRTTTIATLAALALVGGGSIAYASGSLPTLDRTAKGEVDQFGGAARERGDQTETIRSAIKGGKAKSVIVIIGDGMGDSEITSGRNYLHGAGGAFPGLDALPLTGQMTHYSVDKATGRPDYTPDSAATGTAWATGVKSYDGAISVDRTGTPFTSMLQLAKTKGMATGDVTTSEIQDATPAVQVASVASRSCYGPVATSAGCPREAKENGGAGSISEQLLDTRPDVTFGGGSTTFAEKATAGRYQGLTLQQQAKQRGYSYITTTDGLSATTRADQKRPVLGLFAPGNFPVKYAPQVATTGGALQPAQPCRANPDFASVPSVKKMTRKAITLLSTSDHGTKNGFFLQVESASIDKRDHAADACGQIGEMDQLDQAVSEALDYAKKDGNTLVLVTADHAHTSQIVDGDTPGLTTRLRTPEGADMIIAYGTAPAGGSQQHTGSQVRVAGYGPGAANVVGLIDQTDLHFIVRRAMGVSPRQ